MLRGRFAYLVFAGFCVVACGGGSDNPFVESPDANSGGASGSGGRAGATSRTSSTTRAGGGAGGGKAGGGGRRGGDGTGGGSGAGQMGGAGSFGSEKGTQMGGGPDGTSTPGAA